PFGVLQIWRRQRANALALTLACGVLAYPVSLAMRLTQRGAEAANRGAAFLFVAIAYVLAVWGVELSTGPRGHTQANNGGSLASLRVASWIPHGGWTAVFCVYATIIFMGGVAVGWPPPWARLPRPYLVAADSRSIEAQGLAAADWARDVLGPNNRLIADRT